MTIFGLVPALGASLPQFPKLHVTAITGTIALNTITESVILTGTITIPATGSGTLFIVGNSNLATSSIVIGTNGARYNLYVDGIRINGAEHLQQVTATLPVAVQTDSRLIICAGLVSGLASGDHVIQFRAIKTGNVSTATVTGERNLIAIWIP